MDGDGVLAKVHIPNSVDLSQTVCDRLQVGINVPILQALGARSDSAIQKDFDSKPPVFDLDSSDRLLWLKLQKVAGLDEDGSWLQATTRERLVGSILPLDVLDEDSLELRLQPAEATHGKRKQQDEGEGGGGEDHGRELPMVGLHGVQSFLLYKESFWPILSPGANRPYRLKS